MAHGAETSELLGAVLQRSGLSQAELARRGNIPRSVLNAYLRGKRQAGVSALSSLAEAAGFKLTLAPDPKRVGDEVAGRRLVQVLELAEALPYRPAQRLQYPVLASSLKEAA